VKAWERLKLIWRILGYAATLTLLAASRLSTTDQWNLVIGYWAWMILFVVIGQIGWVILLQIAEETRRVLREQKAKEMQGDTTASD
jgi:hypothetical protein